MEKLTAKLSESILDKLSMDFLRNQVLKNAYGNDDTVIAGLDPRILLAWYLFFGLVPWFVSDIPFLLGCFLLVMATTLLARVAGLVLFLFALGVFSQTGYLFIVTLLFGGDASAVAPLLILTLKVATISLASVTVFSGLDPDKLSNGLIPHFITGSMEGSVRVEGLDTRESDVGILAQKVGYRYAAVNKSVKKIKLAALKVTYNDGLFLAISFLVVAVAVLISTLL